MTNLIMICCMTKSFSYIFITRLLKELQTHGISCTHSPCAQLLYIRSFFQITSGSRRKRMVHPPILKQFKAVFNHCSEQFRIQWRVTLSNVSMGQVKTMILYFHITVILWKSKIVPIQHFLKSYLGFWRKIPNFPSLTDGSSTSSQLILQGIK